MSAVKVENILFICSANKDRSATAEHYFADKYSTLSFDSAGTNEKICFQLGTTFVNDEQLSWADKIFVMEAKHKKFVLSNFKTNYAPKITLLNIPDHYTYYQKELIQVLEDKLSVFLKVKS